MNSKEFTTLEALREAVPAERWAAFLALAQYMTAEPEQRLGQCVVNALQPPRGCPDIFYIEDAEAARWFRQFGRYVIRYNDAVDRDCYYGHDPNGVSFEDAERFTSLDAAAAVARSLVCGREDPDLVDPVEVIREGEVDL